MKSEICLNINKSKLCQINGSGTEIGIIIRQMELLGINPAPFIKTAAQDLFNQYGHNAFGYSQEIIQALNAQGDKQAVKIWSKIAKYLSGCNASEGLIFH